MSRDLEKLKALAAKDDSPRVRVVGIAPRRGGGWVGYGPADLGEATLLALGLVPVEDVRSIVSGRLAGVIDDPKLGTELYPAAPPPPETHRFTVRGCDFVATRVAGGWEATGRVSFGTFTQEALRDAIWSKNDEKIAALNEARDGLPIVLGPIDGDWSRDVEAALMLAAEEAYAARPWPYTERRR